MTDDETLGRLDWATHAAIAARLLEQTDRKYLAAEEYYTTAHKIDLAVVRVAKFVPKRG
jgi:hypothetical protein